MNKAVQMIPYADDLAVLPRDRDNDTNRKKANKRGLYMNEHKTKYLTV